MVAAIDINPPLDSVAITPRTRGIIILKNKILKITPLVLMAKKTQKC